ncbi:DNA polymerase III subunit delta [Spiroplasma corruscae]|uniref:DNA polymerase III subunit delta n=1 Tax=Spiroplasma corruscae TaxID=216934 RepID=A0A222ENY6_9MOLU|nr:DNA polymerase III subunit delta [Spiroplasma corruscae]ASP28226.1 DNA polymerase III subunit delta [Spiroplasma corruscae]
MYLVYSKDSYLLNKQISKIINKLLEKDTYEIHKYSLIDSNLSSIYEECVTLSIFSSKKIIIIDECWFLTEKKIKLHSSFDIDGFMKLLNIINDNIILILALNNDNYSKRLKISKEVENRSKVIEIKAPSEDEKKQLLVKRLETLNISYDDLAIDYLLSYLPNDMGIFVNEVEKLINYNTHININLIKTIVNKYMNFDIFGLLDSILANDVNDFINKYRLYIESNNDIFGFIALVSNTYITIRNIIICKESNLNDNEIISKLNINPYRYKIITSKKLDKLELINDKINTLYYLEKNLKNGQFDNKIIPEFKLLQIFK